MLALILIITIGALLIATGLIVYGIYLLLQKEQNNKPKRKSNMDDYRWHLFGDYFQHQMLWLF